MAHIIIDRRKNDKGKSTVNRQRYVRRVKEQVREAVKKTIRDGNIKDITSSDGKKIKIPGKGLKQPTFQHDKGGVTDRVFPGNKEFTQGDRINRPQGGAGGGGNDASPDGEGDDGFEFHLTREEFLDLFFEDLELPDLVKKQISKIDEWVSRRAGFAVDGNPSRLNIERSMRQSKTRRMALRTPKKKKLRELEAELEVLVAEDDNEKNHTRIHELKDMIEALKRKIKAIPFIDDVDLRYNRWEKVPIPATQAVMFAIMDVSASMGEWEKEMAKRFFMLLYMFLFRNYERVEIVFIRHHTSAKEVDEEEFFYSRETGGTLVSTSLELMKEIVEERYNPQQWNIFACQASDGDNWGADSVIAQDHLRHLLPIIQYYAYVEIDRRGGQDSDLWPYYEQIKNAYDNFAMQVITDVAEIYPVFRGLFEKKGATA
jgi:uncharacterized sporulation protein YeaH/YhbH (DUF444 family)